MIIYMEMILRGELPLKTNLSSKELPQAIHIDQYGRYKQLIYKHISHILRSQIKKANQKRYKQYQKVYAYMKEHHPSHSFVQRRYKEIHLKEIYRSRFFKKPDLKNISLNLDNRFFDMQKGKHFDHFIQISLPFLISKGKSKKINIPLKNHKHCKQLLKKGYKRKDNIQIKEKDGKIYVGLIWEKEKSEIKGGGKSMGIDLGYKKLITTSNGEILGREMEKIYEKISRKEQGSKRFKRALRERDSMIGYYCNQLHLEEVNCLMVEDLLNVKHKSVFSHKVNNKLQRWSYRKTLDKLSFICQEGGIEMVKVSPAYSSQRCSKCGCVDKKSRKGELFCCTHCGYREDADINASRNICNRGGGQEMSDMVPLAGEA